MIHRLFAWFILTILGWKEPIITQKSSKRAEVVFCQPVYSTAIFCLNMLAYPVPNLKIKTSNRILPCIYDLYIDNDIQTEKLYVFFDYFNKIMHVQPSMPSDESIRKTASFIDYPTLTSFVTCVNVIPQLFVKNLYVGWIGVCVGIIFFFYNYSSKLYFGNTLKFIFTLLAVYMSLNLEFYVTYLCLGIYYYNIDISRTYLFLGLASHTYLKA